MAEKSKTDLVTDEEGLDDASGIRVGYPVEPDHSEDGSTSAVGMTGQRKASTGGGAAPKSVKGTAKPTKKG